MNIPWTLDAMEALDAIDRTGSFAGAARSLHKAQSAVSYAVRQLEEGLGVALFDRSGHRAVLTPQGRAILEEGRALLARARRLTSLAHRFSEGWEPRLHVVVDGVLPLRPVVVALKQLGEEGVPTHVQVTMQFLWGVQRRFEAEDADLMLTKDFEPQPHLIARPLPDQELVLVCGADHPAARSGPHSREDLHAWLELSVHDSSDEARGVDTHDLGGPRVFYLSDFHAKRQALLLGLGFGWMPLGLVAQDLQGGMLREVGFEAGSRRIFTPQIVHRTDRPLGRAGERLLDLVRALWADNDPGLSSSAR
jgi:DNA-binding transcriptional LysR family regulator